MPSGTSNRQILKSIGILMGAFLLSRMLGFVREWTVAHQMGSNATTDAYYAAFMLPELLTYMVAGGSLEIFFIPVFTKYIIEKKEDEAWHIFSTVLTFIIILLLPLLVLAEIFAPHIVRIIAPGFNPASQAEVVFLTRLMLPGQFFFSLGVVMIAVQNARARFFVPALAGVMYNLAIILGGWLLSPWIGITGFAVGLVVGLFFGYFVLQLAGVWKAGAHFHFSFDFGHPGFRLFLKLAIPVMLALSTVVMDEWLLRYFASFLQAASITWLVFAKTLMRVPLAVVGQAVGTGSYPFLSAMHSEGKLSEFNRTLNHGTRGLILMLVPISTLAIVLREPVVYFVFSRTKMQSGDIQATASCLAFFCIGMVAWGAQNLMSRGFYAIRDTLTPSVVGTITTVLSLPVYWFFARRWQQNGLAMASSICVISYTCLTFFLLARRTKNADAPDLIRFFGKIVAVCVISGFACHYFAQWLQARMAWHNMIGVLQLIVSVSVPGLLFMVLLARIFRIDEFDAYCRKLLPWSRERPQPSLS
jgi:putative peptidoglycan lipid II flippase